MSETMSEEWFRVRITRRKSFLSCIFDIRYGWLGYYPERASSDFVVHPGPSMGHFRHLWRYYTIEINKQINA